MAFGDFHQSGGADQIRMFILKHSKAYLTCHEIDEPMRLVEQDPSENRGKPVVRSCGSPQGIFLAAADVLDAKVDLTPVNAPTVDLGRVLELEVAIINPWQKLLTILA